MKTKIKYPQTCIGKLVLVLFMLLFAIIKTNAQEKPEVVVQSGHQKVINDIAISSDGALMLTGSADNSVILWDLSNGKALKTLQGHKNQISSVEFSKDNKFARSVSWDKVIIKWDLTLGIQTNAPVEFPESKINALSVGEESSYWRDPTVTKKFFDTKTNELVHSIFNFPRTAKIPAIAENRTSYLVIEVDTLSLFDFKTDKLLKVLKKKDIASYVRYATYSPDGFKVVYPLISRNDSKTTLILYNIENDQVQQIKTDLIGETNDIVWTPDGKSIILGIGEKIQSFDLATGRLIRTFKNHISPIANLSVSNNGEYIAIATETKSFLFELFTGKLIKTFDQNSRVHSLGFSSYNNSLITGGNEKIIQWNLQSGELISDISDFYSVYTPRDMAISADGKTLITADWESSLTIRDLTLPKKIEKIQTLSSQKKPNKVRFSPNGKQCASIPIVDYGDDKDNSIRIIDISTGNYVSLPGHYNGTYDFSFSPDGGQIISVGSRNYYSANTSLIKLWDITTGKEINEFGDNKAYPRSVAFSPNGKFFIVGYEEGFLKLWDIQTRTEIRTFNKHNLQVNTVSFTPDGKFVVSTSLDNTVKLWDVESGNLVYTLVIGSGQENQWLIYNDEGYWDGSPNCGDLVTMVKGTESWGIDQFAVKNNRPDKILGSSSISKPELVNHYNTQYLKRIKKLGFVDKNGNPNEALLASDYHVPQARIIESKTTEKFVDLKFNLSDTKYNLKSFNIFVNDVPIYGASGKKIQGKTLEATEKIELTAGDNKIEISCMNEKGAESYRAISTANYKPTTPIKSDLYYIGFGVSKYKDPSLNLNYADKDAKDLGELFNRMKGKYSNVYCNTYLNEECTVENIKKSKELLKNAKPDDILVLFIAGHGMHDTDKDETYYFLTHNTDLKNLKGTAANFETIEDILQGIPPRNKLFLMDACESGEIDEDEQGQTLTAGIDTDILSRGFKATAPIKASNEQRTTKRPYLFQKDRFIYNDLTRRSGAIVFSSSKGGELSYESSAIGNGFFTYQIINAIQGGAKYTKGYVSVDALKEYVIKTVSAFSQGKQNPTVDRDNIYQKFELPITIPETGNNLKDAYPNMAFVKGGKFMNKVIKYFGTAIKVNSFYMGKYEVTQKEWNEIMPTNPSQYVGDSLPVDNVNWYECVEYCNLRSLKEGLEPYYTIDKVNIDKSLDKKIDNLRWRVTPNENANGYRLPTEMEWRYAACGGQLSNWYTLSGSDELTEIAEAVNNIFKQITSPVGKKKPNELGIYDMMGNVFEWCWDWNPTWVTIGYAKRGVEIVGKQRLLLGAWSEIKHSDIYPLSYSSLNKGFRVVRNATKN